MAPVVYQGKVIIGITGVGFGLHLDSDRPGAPVGAVIGIAGQSQRAGMNPRLDHVQRAAEHAAVHQHRKLYGGDIHNGSPSA